MVHQIGHRVNVTGFQKLIEDDYAYLIVVAFVVGVPVSVFTIVWIWKYIAQERYDATKAEEAIAHKRSLQALIKTTSNRARLNAFLFVHTHYGIKWEVFQTCLAFGSCIAYIISTYYDDCVVLNPSFDQWLEVMFVSFFLADYFLQLYLARNKQHWFLSPVALADLLTIVPTVLQLMVNISYNESIQNTFGCGGDTQFFKFVRLVRFLRVVRALRLFRVTRFTSSGEGISHHIAVIVTTLTTLVLVASCLFLYVETYDDANNPDNIQFHEARAARPADPARSLLLGALPTYRCSSRWSVTCRCIPLRRRSTTCSSRWSAARASPSAQRSAVSSSRRSW